MPSKNVIVLVAHPDDEYAFAHNLIQATVREGHNVDVICVTAPNAARIEEFRQSCLHLGVARGSYFTLGLPDNGDVNALSILDAFRKSEVMQKVHPLTRNGLPRHLYTHNPVGEYGHPAHRECSKVGQLLSGLGLVDELWYFAYNYKLAEVTVSDENKPKSKCREIYEREAYILDHFDLINEGFVRAS